jgi:hypothetical protein
MVWFGTIPQRGLFIVTLLMCSFLAISVTARQASKSVDADMIERSVAGAEWLANRANENAERAADAPKDSGLAEWLVVAAGLDQNVVYNEFALILNANGYLSQDLAVQTWQREFDQVLTLHQSIGETEKNLTPREIEAEINALPIVALDQAGRDERKRLMRSLFASLTAPTAKAAASKAADRIHKLYRQAGLEQGQ